jgi:hypothetical protein
MKKKMKKKKKKKMKKKKMKKKMKKMKKKILKTNTMMKMRTIMMNMFCQLSKKRGVVLNIRVEGISPASMKKL